MTPDQIVVTFAGLALIGFVAWFFWMGKREGVKATTSTAGMQEVFITIKGGYTPDVIVAQSGKPLRLNFLRAETASCSEMVIFPQFNKSAQLPEGETVAVELMPDQPGEYEFQCQMGMLRGKLIVE